MATVGEKVLKRLTTPVRFARNEYRKLRASASGKGLKVFWWEDYSNFGDDLNRVLATQWGFQPIRAHPETANLILIGSVLQMVQKDFEGYVFGSGFRSERSAFSLPSASILGVRGELTAKILGVDPKTVVLGDPGLIVVDHMLAASAQDRVAIIPHLEERHSPVYRALAQRLGLEVRFIDVRNRAEAVVREISECRYVLSSSLHGLIVAEALGRKSGWINLDPEAIPPFKFYDYYSAFGEQREPATLSGDESAVALKSLTQGPPARMDAVKRNLAVVAQGLVKRLASSQLADL